MTNNVEIKDLENQIPTIDNNNQSKKLILDTHVLIWYLEGINLTQEHIGLCRIYFRQYSKRLKS